MLDPATDDIVGTVNLGDTEAQSADGYKPTGIIVVSTPTLGP